MFEAAVHNCHECPLGRAAGPSRCPFTPVQRTSGALLCGQGEVPQSVVFVREGLVARTEGGAGGGEAGARVYGPRSLLGLEGLRGLPLQGELRALTPARLCVLPAASLDSWLGPRAAPARTLFELLLDEAEQARASAAWRQGPCHVRLARFALAWPEGGGLPVRKGLAAALLGMRAESFSRALKELVGRGLVEPRAPHRVKDRPGLRAVAEEG